MRYPVFLKLEDKLCVVVGAGRVAERRVRGLCDARARVRVVGVTATEGILKLADEGVIHLYQRAFEPSDLDGSALVIAATDHVDVNRAVQAAAKCRGILFCGADRHTDSDFIVPAVVRRGDLQVAISTGGNSPAYARLLRREIEAFWDDGQLLDLMADLRRRVYARFPNAPERRQAFWQQLVTDDTLALARKGKWAEIEERIEVCLSS
ncbi:MAG: bifunctional precorrin-2 dehydrogenase/sirohydrochlorin ferrochelatase [Gemmatimonadetes bacterium]|nr:bifunctional precorrin-2 dehydrogenase/sirohydrochlorin ferrochelatase [Gemmatimonadota bacterium]MYF75061.1 bifunctional precorrin-2 dehydrogenase/sirohydrochlorin ferrochelatase [Gemmatimonadota bacterium]MYK52798.1 bifunctional precorrin-2 dehydrogenase/sirohydrochlorin ferrochelatase [Gemmatimonadota bacterium]